MMCTSRNKLNLKKFSAYNLLLLPTAPVRMTETIAYTTSTLASIRLVVLYKVLRNKKIMRIFTLERTAKPVFVAFIN